MERGDLTVGQPVKVFDRNGTRAGQPLGGWDGTVVKVKREYVEIDYPRGQRIRDFLIRTQHDKTGFRNFRTLEQDEESNRWSAARAVLLKYGMVPSMGIPIDKMERIAAILEEGEK